MKRLLAATLVIPWLSFVGAQTDPGAADGPRRVRLAQESARPAGAPGMLGLALDLSAWNELWGAGQGVVLAFPLPGRQPVDLLLTSFDPLSPSARFVVVDEQGEHPSAGPPIRFFRGTVAGDADSLVSLNLFENRIAGFVRAFGEEFGIGPREFNLAREGALDVRVWNRRLVAEHAGTPYCDGAIPEPARSAVQRPVTPTGVGPGTALLAHVAVDATVEWFNHFGSLSTAQNYILNLISQVSTLYDAEILVQIDVSYLRVFTAEADPYTNGSTDTGVLLAELRSEWDAHQTGVSRSFVHLFSVRPSGGSGVAYIDVLCGNASNPGNSFDYGVSSIEGNGGAWERDLVAHEFGHNFSSPHTHCYVPEIDKCANQSGCYQGSIVQTVGTIMSYCNTTTSTFGPRVRNEKLRPAAEAAFGTCVEVAGLPGDVRAQTGDALRLDLPPACPNAVLQHDDGSVNSNYGATGSAQLAWIKRFKPSCYPFRLQRVDVLTGHSSVAVGRPVRLLVFTDPAGAGSPGGSTLAHVEDVTLQVVSGSVFNQYVLTSPVTLTSGDFYLGFYDLSTDAPTNFIAAVDTSSNGDAYSAINQTSPGAFAPYAPGTWMIRGAGGPVAAGSVLLSWGDPCNAASVPGQDFAVYRGSIGAFGSSTNLTCTTNGNGSFLAPSVPAGSFFLVVPRTNAAEGSYGQDSEGNERPPAAAACLPQDAANCP